MIKMQYHKNPFPGITTSDALKSHFALDTGPVQAVANQYPMKITPYFLSLMKKPGDPIWRQVVPDPAELGGCLESDDPLSEKRQSPVLNLVHRYPDRVLFLVSDQCAVYCRYCMRKRMVGQPPSVSEETLRAGIDYIRNTQAVREVLLSGGDPLMLTDEFLADILKRLRAISHVEVLRLHTRIPCVMPERITDDLAGMLKKYHPLFINIQFNHPGELTAAASAACGMLADVGIPLGSQTVLLKGVNDDAGVLKALFTGLLKIRVKPYYLHHPDVVKGTDHFRIHVADGLKIVKSLQGRISGMAMPHYMIDLPGGGGKAPLVPEFIREVRDGVLRVEGFDGRVYSYPEE